MTELERRALYNLLRMNWLLDDSMAVEPWQVENYREMPMKLILQRLGDEGVSLDQVHFQALGDSYDTPEELCDELLEGLEADVQSQDKVYLLIFELWRRLVPEKQCLSIFCDELDHQIYLYDQGQMIDEEVIQDVLANLQSILDDNTDEGGNPSTIFESICAGCANDVESFLYDFIAEQIDKQDYPYASDLIEGFSQYLGDDKWFLLLRARLLSLTESEAADELIAQLIRKAMKESDLEFNLEILSFMVQQGDEGLFLKLAKKTRELLRSEDDFQDLLAICADYCSYLDCDEEEKALQQILDSRESKQPNAVVDPEDPQIEAFLEVLKHI